MKPTFLAGLATGALILTLGGCATPSPKVQLTVAQALSVAEVAVDGANQGATTAANSGLLKGASATQVKGYLDAANTATSAAYQANKNGNLAQAAALATTALANLASAHDSTPKK